MGSVPGDPELVRNTHTHTPHVPPDRFHLTYLILFLSGVGTLLPWNVFITERAYFELKLTVPPFPSAITNSFESVFGMTFMTANVLGLVWLVRGDTLSKLPTLARVPIPLLVMGGSCCATGALTDVKEMSGNASTTVTLATLLALGALTALVQGGTFHDASKLHPKYNNALMAGQAAAGVISATFALVCTAGIQGTTGHTSSGNTSSSGDAGGPGQDDARTRQLITNQARAYFYGAGVVLFVCGLAASWLHKTPFFKSHSQEKRERTSSEETLGDAETDEYEECDEDDEVGLHQVVTAIREPPGADIAEPLLPLSDDVTPKPQQTSVWFETKRCYRFAVCATFAVTLTVFPAVTSAIAPVGKEFNKNLWTPSLFLLFNVFDLAGRGFGNFLPKRGTRCAFPKSDTRCFTSNAGDCSDRLLRLLTRPSSNTHTDCPDCCPHIVQYTSNTRPIHAQYTPNTGLTLFFFTTSADWTHRRAQRGRATWNTSLCARLERSRG